MTSARRAIASRFSFCAWVFGRSSWNAAHKRYLSGLLMPRPAQQIVFQECIHAVDDATERLARLTHAVEDALAGWKWQPVVEALMSLRGFQILNAMTLVAEGVI